MSRAASVPAEADVLCEGCGYVLNGLPEGSRCPECGKPAAESASTLRRPPPWEVAGPNALAEAGAGPLSRFLKTTADCIFRPTQFFRTMSVQPSGRASRRFARIHCVLNAVLFGLAAWMHASWFGSLGGALVPPWHPLVLLLVIGGAYLFMIGITDLGARLTTFEATYRGIRLPLPIVRRGLEYHAAHYLPVSLLAALTVVGYQILLVRLPSAGLYGAAYLYVLCGEVVLTAAYLFKTYWTAMRNMMYGNR